MSLVLSETEGKCHSIKQRSSTAMPWTLWIRELCPEGGCAGCCRTHVSIPGPIHEMPVISSPRHPYPAMTTSSVQLVSRVQLCDPMDCSTPVSPVSHQLQELAQTHVCQVSDAIQPSHPLSSPSPPTFNLSQHQGLF